VSYVFFPGCSLDGTAKDYHRSTLAVAAKLGLEIPELKDWICCGSTAAHSTDPLLADALPAKSLASAGGPRSRWLARRATAGSKRPITISPETRRFARAWRAWWAAITTAAPRCATCSKFSARDRPRAHRPSHPAPAEGAEGGLLLRLPAHPSTRGHQLRRRREPHAHGPAVGDGRRHAA